MMVCKAAIRARGLRNYSSTFSIFSNYQQSPSRPRFLATVRRPPACITPTSRSISVPSSIHYRFPSFRANALHTLVSSTSGPDLLSTSSSPQPGDFFLRIMPLGASVTQGVGSSCGNGYRQLLRNQLRAAGWDVNMVGKRASGNMKNNAHSGFPGNRIDQVHQRALDSFQFQPNLVLINAGSNDLVQDFDIMNAPTRMELMLNHLFSHITGTTIVLSTLLDSAREDIRCYRPWYNEALRDIVERRQGYGEAIVLAEMDDERIKVEDMHEDGVHPLDAGYGVMCEIWFAAISNAQRRRFLSAPTEGVIEDINKDD